MTNKSSWNIIFFRGLAKFIDLIIVIVFWKIFPQAGLFIGIFYLLISDGIFKGSSVGKKFLRLKVLNSQKNYPADFRDSIIRNLPLGISLFFLMIPLIGIVIFFLIMTFEFFIIIGDSEGKRVGDYLANTEVVEE